MLSGGFVLIDRKAWQHGDGLDERYFLYCEEVDFFYRLGQHGHSFMRVAEARAVHDIGHGQVFSPMRVSTELAARAGIATIRPLAVVSRAVPMPLATSSGFTPEGW